MAVPRRTQTLLRKLAHQVGAEADDTVRELARSWLEAWDRLSPAWRDAVAAILDDYQRTGIWPAPWQSARIEAVARAQQQSEQQLGVLLAEAAGVTRAAAARVSESTVVAEPAVIGSQLPDGHRPVAVPLVVITAALTARQQRITALHRPIAGQAADVLRRLFTRPPASLDDTEQTARLLYNQARAGFDNALTRAATIARTEPIDTYRTASALIHQANPALVTGWCWQSALDRRTCLTCWALHGRRFSLDTAGPDGHPGCRCQRLPVVGDNTLPTAEARFRRLTRRDQIAILGPARWSLWHSGRIGWADLAVQRSNPGWRSSWTPRPARSLELLAARRAA